jgi:prepilin peptidase CpaA
MSIIAMYLVFAMLAVLWLDVTRFIIPNWLVGSLLLLYPVALYMHSATIDWPMAIVGMLLTFTAGYFLFVMKWMGGGDVKLLAVNALWIGFNIELLQYILAVSVIGGIFTLVLIAARKWVPFIPRYSTDKPVPRILQANGPVPYGVAIALAFLFWIVSGKIPVLMVG